MTRKIKSKTGRVILITAEDRKILNKYFLAAEDAGSTLTHPEMCNQIFHIGLHVAMEQLAEVGYAKGKE